MIMSNKWRTTVAEADAVLERYSVDPADPSGEVLLRKWEGIDRTVLDTLKTTLKAITSVTDPKVDGETFSGTWIVGDVYYAPQNSGSLAGSTSIIQELKPGYSYCTPNNKTIVKTRAYPVEQNENSWMYYERFKKEETTRWHNITASAISELFDNMRQIRTWTAWYAARVEEDDSYTGPTPEFNTYYYDRKHLYDIIFIDPNDDYSNPSIINPVTTYGYTESEYYMPKTATYEAASPTWGSVVDWWFSSVNNPQPPVADMVAQGNTVIRECWTELNKDGSYDLYRTIETTTTTAIMRTRALQYAGMIRVSGLPALDDTTITLIGFLDTDEWIYKDARFRIGSDTYRVLADAQVSGGAVTLSITPAVSQATEDAADTDPEQCQAYFEAL